MRQFFDRYTIDESLKVFTLEHCSSRIISKNEVIEFNHGPEEIPIRRYEKVTLGKWTVRPKHGEELWEMANQAFDWNL